MDQQENIPYRPHHYQGHYCSPVPISAPPPPPRGWSGFSSNNLVEECDYQAHHQYWNEGRAYREKMSSNNSRSSYHQPNRMDDVTQPYRRPHLNKMPYKNVYPLHQHYGVNTTRPESNTSEPYNEILHHEGFDNGVNFHHHPQQQREPWIQQYGAHSRQPPGNREYIQGQYPGGMHPQYNNRVSGDYSGNSESGAMYPDGHNQRSSSWQRSIMVSHGNNYHH